MSAAFEAFAAVMQHPSVRQHGGSGGRHGGGRQHPPAAGGQADAGQSSASTQEEALRFLQLFRAPLPAITDLWWAHFAALLHSLVAAAQAGGPLVLRRPALQPLLHSLCCDGTAHMVVQLLLAHPSYTGSGGSADEPAAHAAPAGGRGRKRGGAAGRAGGREGGGRAGGSRKDGSPREALAMAAALLAHDVPAFLSGCCELLRPEANCPLTVRVEAIAGGCAGADVGAGSAMSRLSIACLQIPAYTSTHYTSPASLPSLVLHPAPLPPCTRVATWPDPCSHGLCRRRLPGLTRGRGGRLNKPVARRRAGSPAVRATQVKLELSSLFLTRTALILSATAERACCWPKAVPSCRSWCDPRWTPASLLCPCAATPASVCGASACACCAAWR